jgi:F-type H+-transporting ATPase subunit b
MRIDLWTLALQAINVLILLWLLKKFFFRPVVGIIEKRQAHAHALIADAEGTRAAADAARAELDVTWNGLAAERSKLLAEARAEADAIHATRLKEAEDRAAQVMRDSEASWRRERESLEREMFGRAGKLATIIAGRLLQRFPPDAATTLFVDALPGQLADLPLQSRKILEATARAGKSFEVVSATGLTAEQRQRCQAALAGVAGGAMSLTFRIDPAVIAGIEIHAPELVVRDSWRNDLERIAKDLGADIGSHPGV